MKKLIIIILLSFTFFFSSVAYSQPAQSVQFVTLSDFHFNPYYSCAKQVPCPLIKALQRAPATQWASILLRYDPTISTYFYDSNYALINSALHASSEVVKHNKAQFMIVLGDFLAHEYRTDYAKYSGDPSMAGYQAFVHKTFQFINSLFAKQFPDKTIYMVVGNNDSYGRDYSTQTSSAFFSDMSTLWSQLIKDPAARASMQKTFSEAGYYAVNLSGMNTRLIILNTNVFSYKALGSGINAAAQKELAWLKSELLLAQKNKQRVFIAMHIPPSIDMYASPNFRLFSFFNLWRASYKAQFESILSAYTPIIAGVLVGHLHKEWLQMQTYNSKYQIPLSGTPSISPFFGGSPGFKSYTYDMQSGDITAASTYLYSMRYGYWYIDHDIAIEFSMAQEN